MKRFTARYSQVIALEDRACSQLECAAANAHGCDGIKPHATKRRVMLAKKRKHVLPEWNV
jgi:hypothetical protein